MLEASASSVCKFPASDEQNMAKHFRVNIALRCLFAVVVVYSEQTNSEINESGS